MQPVALRRVSRRSQPGRASLGLSHTSTSAESTGGIQLSAGYREILNDAIQLAHHEQSAWAGSTIAGAQQVRRIKEDTRRQAADEARRRVEQQRRDEETLLARRDIERRARAAAREEAFRLELERIREEREQAEQQRRAVEEARRAAEEAQRREAEQVLRREQERQRSEREEAEQQRRAAEEAQRRAAEERERQEQARVRRDREQEDQRQREVAEAQRRATEEVERRRRERLRPCIVCMDENDFATLAQLPCSHWSCRNCLRDGFEASLAARTQFQCCQQHVPVTLLSDVLLPDFMARYELIVLEQTTPNPMYCADAACASFIPPANYHGPDAARCRCGTETCRHCRTTSHAGRGCTADTATEQVRALAAIVGWKTCPACGTMVERRDGCLHMSCRCGAEFCYRCGGYWRSCRSRCAGRYF